MSKRTSPIPPQTAGSITGVLILGSLILSLWGREGGPAWAQLLGVRF
jgi:hypothetical protein